MESSRFISLWKNGDQKYRVIMDWTRNQEDQSEDCRDNYSARSRRRNRRADRRMTMAYLWSSAKTKFTSTSPLFMPFD
ncbi:unnamed protein product, partial [Brassica oleracea]